jgi:hypothetical protein
MAEDRTRPEIKIALNDNISSQGSVIVCPICGLEYNHVQSLGTRLGHDNYQAGWSGRGNLHVITMSCEEGHTWELCLGEHKGNVFFFGRRMKQAE